MTMTKKRQSIAVSIRWMIRKDMPDVEAIEQACFEFPWDTDAFIRCLRQRNCIGMVAQHGGVRQGDGTIVGFMIYELHKHRLHVLNFAVHPDWRFKGVGRAMIDRLKGKLSESRRARMMLEVRESNLDALLFFRALGFRAASILRQFYEETSEDAYLMEFMIT